MPDVRVIKDLGGVTTDEFLLMDFAEAMRAVQDGLAVKRESWIDKNARVQVQGDALCLWDNHQDGVEVAEYAWHPWLISADDIKGRDWMV